MHPVDDVGVMISSFEIIACRLSWTVPESSCCRFMRSSRSKPMFFLTSSKPAACELISRASTPSPAFKSKLHARSTRRSSSARVRASVCRASSRLCRISSSCFRPSCKRSMSGNVAGCCWTAMGEMTSLSDIIRPTSPRSSVSMASKLLWTSTEFTSVLSLSIFRNESSRIACCSVIFASSIASTSACSVPSSARWTPSIASTLLWMWLSTASSRLRRSLTDSFTFDCCSAIWTSTMLRTLPSTASTRLRKSLKDSCRADCCSAILTSRCCTANELGAADSLLWLWTAIAIVSTSARTMPNCVRCWENFASNSSTLKRCDPSASAARCC
mmetsp:Transcript_12842/g.28977  ORF Transcript_12842/g.28977 Transcript_12842/m.28977 type:complete len:329 (+) Transcript_12842:621-1607(+)